MGRGKRLQTSILETYIRAAAKKKEAISLSDKFTNWLTQYKAQALQSLEDEYKKKSGEIAESHKESSEKATAVYERQAAELKEENADQNNRTRKACDEAIERARQTRQDKLNASRAALEELRDLRPEEWASWDDPLWKAFTPKEKMSSPPVTRIGEIEVPSLEGSCSIPALMHIIGNTNLLMNAQGAAKERALKITQGIILRMLVTIPPGKLKLILIDPVGLGSNMAGFMHLPEKIVGRKIWTEPQEIDQSLAALTVHMETVIQKYLRNDFASMEEYNQKAGEVEEAYRLLVVANFPMAFTEGAAQRLVNIAANGPRSGVYVLAARDSALKLPYNFQIDELARLSTVLDFEEDRVLWRDPVFESHTLRPEDIPEGSDFVDILKTIGDEALAAGTVEVPFTKALERLDTWWGRDCTSGLEVPIGRAGARELMHFSAGSAGLVHALVGGKTGKGKSNLLHVLIMALCTHYHPDELVLYLVDFKRGIEFKTYADGRLRHARVVAVQSEREFGASVLEKLDQEMARRGDLFREKGVADIKDYIRLHPDEPMPRLLFLADEFQEFFSEDDALAQKCAQLLDRLARQGRSFGIHLVMATQSISGNIALSRSTLDQFAIRMALQLSESDSRIILGEDNPDAKLLDRPGEALYNDANGRREGNTRFQVFFMPDEVRDAHLARLEEMYRDCWDKPPRQIVFEGDEPGSVSENDQLGELIEAPSYLEEVKTPLAWMGEPIAIAPHVGARFSLQAGSNLLIAGSNEEAGVSMLLSGMLSLAAQKSPAQASFHVIDLAKADTEWKDMLSLACNELPHDVTLYRKREPLSSLGDIFRTFQEREESGKAGPRIFIIFIAPHRARDLRVTDPFGEQSPEAEQFFTLLREGPDVGIHTLCWIDSMKSVDRYLNRSLPEFDMRVALPMSADESNSFLDSGEAGKLPRHRALYYEEEMVGRLVKFRPYRLPDPPFLTRAGYQLREAWNETAN